MAVYYEDFFEGLFVWAWLTSDGNGDGNNSDFKLIYII